MDEIKLNLENLTEDERSQLMTLVKKANQKKEKVWKPVEGDTYYAIDVWGNIRNFTWIADDQDMGSYKFGNCFKTVEEAKFAVKKRKVEVKLQRFADEHNDDGFDVFDRGRKKYYIGCLCRNGELFIDSNCVLLSNNVVFSSKEIAKQAIKTVGEDRIKKYIFGVK